MTLCSSNVGCDLLLPLQAAYARGLEKRQQHVQQLQEELSHATTETEAARQQLADAASLKSDTQVDSDSLLIQAGTALLVILNMPLAVCGSGSHNAETHWLKTRNVRC